MVFNQRILSICFAVFSFLSFRLGMCSIPFSLVHVGACLAWGLANPLGLGHKSVAMHEERE
jgi:hypothetical protein